MRRQDRKDRCEQDISKNCLSSNTAWNEFPQKELKSDNEKIQSENIFLSHHYL